MASRSLILLLLRLRCDNMGQSWRAPRPLLILLSLSSNRLSFGNLGKPLSVVRPTLIKLSDSKLTYSSLRPSICVARALSRFSSSIWKEKVQFYCNLSTFLHFLPPHNNAALSYILTGGTRLTRLWRIWPSRYKLCYKRTKPPYCHTPSQTKFPFPNPFHPLFLSLKNLGNYAKNFNKHRLAKSLLQGWRKVVQLYASAYWQHSAPLPPLLQCLRVLPLSVCMWLTAKSGPWRQLTWKNRLTLGFFSQSDRIHMP